MNAYLLIVNILQLLDLYCGLSFYCNIKNKIYHTNEKFSTTRKYNSHSSPNGAYIHIPFCRRRCFYCDFPIKVVGERITTRQKESDDYTDIIIKEINFTNINNMKANLDTIYFGGGTPSLLSDSCILYCY